MQFCKGQRRLLCAFANPLDIDYHNRTEGSTVLEGKYWKRKLVRLGTLGNFLFISLKKDFIVLEGKYRQWNLVQLGTFFSLRTKKGSTLLHYLGGKILETEVGTSINL